MAVETELKLRIAPENLARLRRHPLLRKCQLTPPVTRRLYNIYFDTPRFALCKAAVALRLRRVKGKWLQTLKGCGSVKGGLHQHNELEAAVSSAVLDFFSPQTREWKKHLPQQKKLQPIFTSDFYRTSRMLDWHGAHIELCMDHGEVRAGQQHSPLCELELELKSGEPACLFELALALQEIAPLELESVSKAEQGYRLLKGYAEKPVKGTSSPLSEKDTLAEVLQMLIWSCLAHFQANLHGMMASEDTEYLHQMRVALRRLRVVLRIAEKSCRDETLGSLRQEVATLCIALGRVRELDVFISQTMQPLCAQMPDQAGLHALLAASEQKRADCYAGLRSATQAREIQRLQLRLALWMNGSYWHQKTATVSMQDFASHHLRRLTRRFVKPLQQLETYDEPQLHALRIAAKKLRYSLEFFAALYGKRKMQQFILTLSEVQEVLGQINDAAIAYHLLDDLALLPENREAAALVKGWIAHGEPSRFAALCKAIKLFGRRADFWGKHFC